jgi:hypothetical protein
MSLILKENESHSDDTTTSKKRLSMKSTFDSEFESTQIDDDDDVKNNQKSNILNEEKIKTIITNENYDKIVTNVETISNNFTNEALQQYYKTESVQDYPWLSSLLISLIVEFKDLYHTYVAMQQKLEQIPQKYPIKQFIFPKEIYNSLDIKNNQTKIDEHEKLLLEVQARFISIEQAAMEIDIKSLHNKMFCYNFAHDELRKKVQTAFNETFEFDEAKCLDKENLERSSRMVTLGTNWIKNTVHLMSVDEIDKIKLNFQFSNLKKEKQILNTVPKQLKLDDTNVVKINGEKTNNIKNSIDVNNKNKTNSFNNSFNDSSNAIKAKTIANNTNSFRINNNHGNNAMNNNSKILSNNSSNNKTTNNSSSSNYASYNNNKYPTTTASLNSSLIEPKTDTKHEVNTIKNHSNYDDTSNNDSKQFDERKNESALQAQYYKKQKRDDQFKIQFNPNYDRFNRRFQNRTKPKKGFFNSHNNHHHSC